MTDFREFMEMNDGVPGDETLNEKMWFDYRSRGNKKIKKWHTDRKNFRIQINKKTGQPKEVYISPTERLKRKIGQRKAALKRKAKQRNITAKRVRSFGIRTKWGMKYNTKGHTARRHARGNTDPYKEKNSLHPNMMEQLLLEFPHVEILPDIYWDFYEERGENDGEWLMQLVSLYRDHKMVSMDYGKPGDNNVGCGEDGTIDVEPEDIERITYSLCQEYWFLKHAREAYKSLSSDDRELFDLYVDERLLAKLVPDDLL